jgi:diacylglycerol O-acyltransferase
MGFGLTGCRRTVPHLQRLLTYLDDDATPSPWAAWRRRATGLR